MNKSIYFPSQKFHRNDNSTLKNWIALAFIIIINHHTEYQNSLPWKVIFRPSSSNRPVPAITSSLFPQMEIALKSHQPGAGGLAQYGNRGTSAANLGPISWIDKAIKTIISDTGTICGGSPLPTLHIFTDPQDTKFTTLTNCSVLPTAGTIRHCRTSSPQASLPTSYNVHRAAAIINLIYSWPRTKDCRNRSSKVGLPVGRRVRTECDVEALEAIQRLIPLDSSNTQSLTHTGRENESYIR